MISEYRQWSGDEWEQHISMLLKRHYAPGQFQQIPAKDRGDAGLEGFTNDGCAYQCYAPEEPLTLAQRAEKHKRKVYRDVKKFRENAPLLTTLLGQTKIKCWILVVPTFDSKDVIAYGEQQAVEVRMLNLSYVASDFCVRIITDDQFALEHKQLMGVGLAKIALPIVQPAPEEIAQWSAGHTAHVETLDGKLNRMKPGSTPAAKAELRSQLIGHFVAGQNAIDHLHANHEELYEEVIALKAQQEQFLATESLTAVGLPINILRDTVTTYERKLEAKLLGLDSHAAKALVWEAVSDWLMRCPLDFEEVA